MNLRTVYRDWQEGIRAIVTQLLAFETANTSALDAKQPLDATLSAIADESLGAFSHRNKVINGRFAVNQSGYVSGAAVDSELYGHDMWKMAAAGDSYTYSTTNNKTTVTIPAGKVLRTIIEGLSLQDGTYVLSWEGTAQGKIGAGSYGASGVTGSITGGVNTTIEFGPGTVANVQLETGTVPTPFGDRPYGTELALCQRHYYRVTSWVFNTHAYSTTGCRVLVPFPVVMRTSPTVFAQSGTATDYRVTFEAATTACSIVPLIGALYNHVGYLLFLVASGLVPGQSGIAREATSSGFLAFSCRL